MTLLDGFFRSPAVETIFSDASTVQAILDFESALARSQSRAGLTTAANADAIEASCRVELFELAALRQAMPAAGNLAIPLLKQLNTIVARTSPDAARYVHFGATSQDALDTALVLQTRAAVAAVDSDLAKVIKHLSSLAETHRNTLLVARTWLQHALPTTFGYVAATWLDALLRDRDRLRRLTEECLALQFGGAAGTLAALGNDGGKVAGFLAEELELPLARIPWHGQRDRVGEVACAFGSLASSFAKVARDLALYMQTEVGELREAPATGRGGSSTMPHKQNPVATAAILASTLRVPALVATVLQAGAGEYQRSLGAWQTEWEVVPEIVRLTAGAGHHLANLLPGLQVNAGKMTENLELTRGMIYAEAVSIALSERLNRATAHRLVENACRTAQAGARHLREVLNEVPEVIAILPPPQIASLFEPANYLGSADTFISAVLAAANKQAALLSPIKGQPDAHR
jgi:3-carboxy-cis,cis-muconate cycloisomerase